MVLQACMRRLRAQSPGFSKIYEMCTRTKNSLSLSERIRSVFLLTCFSDRENEPESTQQEKPRFLQLNVVVNV